MRADMLYEQRKTAIHLLRSGLSKDEVAFRLHRSRGWVYKWWNRYNKNKDFTDLSTHSRAPSGLLDKFCNKFEAR